MPKINKKRNTFRSMQKFISKGLLSLILGLMFMNSFSVALADKAACDAIAVNLLQDRVVEYEKNLEKFTIQATLAAEEIVLHTKNALINLYDSLSDICNNLGNDFEECSPVKIEKDASGNSTSLITSNAGTASSTEYCNDIANQINEQEEVISKEIMYNIIFQQKTYFIVKRLELFVSKLQTFVNFLAQDIIPKLQTAVQSIDELVKDPLK